MPRAALWLWLVERRWYNVVREVDFLRFINRSRQSDGARRSLGSFGSGHTSWLGLVLAGESARTVQPRVVRRGRQALGSNEKASLVERRPAKMGRQRRARLQS